MNGKLNLRPSDKLSAKAKFLNAQQPLEFSRLDAARGQLIAIGHLSSAQRRTLLRASPSFVAHDGGTT
jgi:hypothetical protein